MALIIENLCVDLVPHREPWFAFTFEDLGQAGFPGALTASSVAAPSCNHWATVTALFEYFYLRRWRMGLPIGVGTFSAQP